MVKDFRALQERLRSRILTEIEAGELTGLELARQTGFQQAHISNFLNRKRGLSLEAMDEILRARKLTIAELMRARDGNGAERHTIEAEAADATYIPLVGAEHCHAIDIPFTLSRSALQVMSSRLQKMPVRMRTPRPHWRRFIAIRVNGRDAEAMAPMLARGATAIVDRHANDPDGRSVYLARTEKRVVLRYVEKVGDMWVLRAERARSRLERMESERDIVGRVCAVIHVEI